MIRAGERGQLYSTDALLAFVIFAFALVLVSGITNQLENQFVASTAQEYNRLSAARVAESLLSSPGDPVYWDGLSDRNGVYRVGFSDGGGGIDLNKWSAFQDWNAADYASLKSVLGIGDREFYLALVDVNRLTLAQSGISPVDANNVALVMLPALYEGVPVMMNIQVYST